MIAMNSLQVLFVVLIVCPTLKVDTKKLLSRDEPDPCPNLNPDHNQRKLLEMSSSSGQTRLCCGCPANYSLQIICQISVATGQIMYDTTKCKKCPNGYYIEDNIHLKTICDILPSLPSNGQTKSVTPVITGTKEIDNRGTSERPTKHTESGQGYIANRKQSESDWPPWKIGLVVIISVGIPVVALLAFCCWFQRCRDDGKEDKSARAYDDHEDLQSQEQMVDNRKHVDDETERETSFSRPKPLKQLSGGTTHSHDQASTIDLQRSRTVSSTVQESEPLLDTNGARVTTSVPDFCAAARTQERSNFPEDGMSTKTVWEPSPGPLARERAANKTFEVGYTSSSQHQAQINGNRHFDLKILKVPENFKDCTSLPSPSTDDLSSSESDCDQPKNQTTTVSKKAFEEGSPVSAKSLPSCLSTENMKKHKSDRNQVEKILRFVSLELRSHKSVVLKSETVKEFSRRNSFGYMEISEIQKESGHTVDFLHNIIVQMHNKQGDSLTAEKIVGTLKESGAVLLAQELEKELDCKN